MCLQGLYTCPHVLSVCCSLQARNPIFQPAVQSFTNPLFVCNPALTTQTMARRTECSLQQSTKDNLRPSLPSSVVVLSHAKQLLSPTASSPSHEALLTHGSTAGDSKTQLIQPIMAMDGGWSEDKMDETIVDRLHKAFCGSMPHPYTSSVSQGESGPADDNCTYKRLGKRLRSHVKAGNLPKSLTLKGWLSDHSASETESPESEFDVWQLSSNDGPSRLSSRTDNLYDVISRRHNI